MLYFTIVPGKCRWCKKGILVRRSDDGRVICHRDCTYSEWLKVAKTVENYAPAALKQVRLLRKRYEEEDQGDLLSV